MIVSSSDDGLLMVSLIRTHLGSLDLIFANKIPPSFLKSFFGAAHSKLYNLQLVDIVFPLLFISLLSQDLLIGVSSCGIRL